MPHVRFPLLLAGALACTGCFQMTTVVRVNGDASGTVDHSMLFTKAAIAQVRQFSALSGGGGNVTLDLTSEQQAREMAASLGPGVTYVSSEPLATPDAEGRRATYAFTDIAQLRLNKQPDVPGGINVESPVAGVITSSLTHAENGNAVLHIRVGEQYAQGGQLGDADRNQTFMQQLPMLKALLRGAHMHIAVEPNGTIVSTNSPYVEGQRVTLVDIDADQVLANDDLLARLNSAKTVEDVKAALHDAPGLKMVLEPEITIEFTPAR